LACLESDWIIQRHILRERGVVVAGPAPHTLIDPVAPDDLRRAVVGFLREWWLPMLHNRPAAQQRVSSLRRSHHVPGALYTPLWRRRHQAGRSTMGTEALGERWAALIEWALVWRPGTPSDNMAGTLDYIRYTLSCVLTPAPESPAPYFA